VSDQLNFGNDLVATAVKGLVEVFKLVDAVNGLQGHEDEIAAERKRWGEQLLAEKIRVEQAEAEIASLKAELAKVKRDRDALESELERQRKDALTHYRILQGVRDAAQQLHAVLYGEPHG